MRGIRIEDEPAGCEHAQDDVSVALGDVVEDEAAALGDGDGDFECTEDIHVRGRQAAAVDAGAEVHPPGLAVLVEPADGGGIVTRGGREVGRFLGRNVRHGALYAGLVVDTADLDGAAVQDVDRAVGEVAGQVGQREPFLLPDHAAGHLHPRHGDGGLRGGGCCGCGVRRGVFVETHCRHGSSVYKPPWSPPPSPLAAA